MEIPIPDDWDGETFCRWAVCWPESSKWKAILYGLIESPKQGRFWDGKTGNIVDTQSSFLPAYDENFNLEGVLMACNDPGLSDIAAALTLMATAMREQNSINVSNRCCDSGSAGQGATAPPYSSIEQGNPITDDPPSGFDDWGEYNANKCAIATDIVATLRADVSRMSFINMVGKTIAGLAPILIATFLTPVPGDEVLIICAYLVAVIGFGGAFLAAVEVVLDDCEQDLICALYNGADALSAETLFETAFNDCWDSSVYAASLYGFSAKGLIASMIGSPVVNRLFSLETDRNLPAGDCSSCVCVLFNLFPSAGVWTHNLIVSETSDSVTTSAGDYSDRNRYDAGILFQATDYNVCCGSDVEILSITIDSGSIASGPDASGAGYYLYDCAGTQTYFHATVQPIGQRGQVLHMISANAFTVTITIGP